MILMLLVEIKGRENKEIFNILQNNLNELLNNISEKDIEEQKKHIRDNTRKYEICSIKVGNDGWRIKECFDTYITSVENEVCKRIKAVFIKQIALYQLSCEGKFMPIGHSCPLPKLQFDIIHSGGNTVVCIKLNFLTLYNTYLKIV